MQLELLHAIDIALTKAPLEGWSSCVIGLCFNVIVTVVGGLILDYFPNLLPASDKVILRLSWAEVHSKYKYSATYRCLPNNNSNNNKYKKMR
jgi:hypothetical protein